ncbi:hypothetical protein HID58_020498 [Brassica napus]|uniref:Uncharacterized protein n=1 Tax=Brassica napus TaxID=3708 RepID=A0ABQ7XJ17_BRANA|nr:hypothetical protein HID58_020498 [Brassica napus]
MHNKDCVLMGLTWLLAKNRTAYFPTVTSVLRAVMLNQTRHHIGLAGVVVTHADVGSDLVVTRRYVIGSEVK